MSPKLVTKLTNTLFIYYQSDFGFYWIDTLMHSHSVFYFETEESARLDACQSENEIAA